MKKLGILSAVASLAMGAIGRALSAPISHHLGRTRYLTGYAKGGWRHFDPRINRHTGKPHEHKREIARRERQAAARSV